MIEEFCVSCPKCDGVSDHKWVGWFEEEMFPEVRRARCFDCGEVFNLYRGNGPWRIDSKIALKDEYDEKIIEKLREFLGKEGIEFFKKLKTTFESYTPVIDTKKYDLETLELRKFPKERVPGLSCDIHLPHPVHLREGMTVRNFIRETGLWKEEKNEEDNLDDWYVFFIEMVLKNE